MTTEPSQPSPAPRPPLRPREGSTPSSLPPLTEHPSARRGGCVIAIVGRSPREPDGQGRTPSLARDVTGPAGEAHALSVPAAAGPRRAGPGPSAGRLGGVPSGAPAHGSPQRPRRHRQAAQPPRDSPAPRVLRGAWHLSASSRPVTGRTRPSPGTGACHCSVEPDTSSEPAGKGWPEALVPGCRCHQSVCDSGESPQLVGGAHWAVVCALLVQHPFIRCPA